MPTLQNERHQLIELYKHLRVADVRDGMDWLMMHHYGSMSPDIRPLFRARACGIARTARYLPFQGPVPKMTPEEYTEWVDWYYQEVCTYPWIQDIEDGDFVVIDQSGLDAGLIGSCNSLDGIRRGTRGYVINGGARDTDEIALQKIPLWCKFASQTMSQGRVQFDTKDVPVAVGGVVVYQGDVIVADGDGVIVVPRKIAVDVGKHAQRILASDKIDRKELYELLGMELDETVT
jgi:regulator of RNase E activity RraA